MQSIAENLLLACKEKHNKNIIAPTIKLIPKDLKVSLLPKSDNGVNPIIL